MATAGMVSPMLASAEPNARFMLVCNRSFRAACMAAMHSGNNTIMAMMIPTNELGAPMEATPASSEGDSFLASNTTAPKQAISKNRLVKVVLSDGGVACVSSASLRLPFSSLGKKYRGAARTVS